MSARRIFLIGIACGIHSACSDAPHDSTKDLIRTSQSGGTGSLSVGLVDLPTDAKNVWVTLRDVNVRKCDESGWTNLPLHEGTFDLLTLRDGLVGALVDRAALPTGRYCELRLVVDSPARLVLTTGEEHELKVPSGSSSGVKIKGEFLVVPGLNTEVIVDFDAAASIHQTGSGRFQMKPVLRVDRVEYEATTGTALTGATLTDFVNFQVGPTTNGVVALPGGATIEFASGAVSSSQEFTVTMWTPRLADALGNIYVFSPSYEFQNSAIITLPVKNGGVAPTIYWDYEGIPTQWSTLTQDTSLATASISHFSCGGAASRFDGFSNASWFSNPVVELEWRGVFSRSEFSNDYFDPSVGNAEAPMKREEVVALIVRAVFDKALQDLDPLTARVFDDVPTNHKFARYIAYAKQQGIIDGCGDGTNFCLGDDLGRAELAAMITRVLEVKGDADITSKIARYSTKAAAAEFSDVRRSEPLDWFYSYVYAVRDKGFMKGDGNTNTFRPGDPVNRVEAAKVVCYLAYTRQGCGICKAKQYAPDMAALYATTNVFAHYGSDNKFRDFDSTETHGGNCTNFASQALLGGLLESASLDVVFDNRLAFADRSGDPRWYWNDFGDFGGAFIKVDDMRKYAQFGPGYRGLQFTHVTTIEPGDWAEYADVRTGDIVFADWEDDSNFDHTMIVTRIDRFNNPNAIRLTYQSEDKRHIGMHDIWTLSEPKAVFDVYRPDVFRSE